MSLATRALALVALCMSGLAPAMAQVPLMPYQEYEKRIKSAQKVGPLASDLFGESVSLYNGSTEFVVADIDVPGNNALPVRLGRRFTVSSKKDIEILGGFGSWDVDVPYIHGTFIDNWMGHNNLGRRCSEFARPLGSGVFKAEDFWSGTKMYVPGKGDQDILRIGDQNGLHAKMKAPTDGHSYRLGTKSFDRIRCKPSTANGFPGEAFIAVDASGTTMTFDWMLTRSAGVIEKITGNDHGNDRLGRTTHYLMLTRMEDRFGNSVTYSYSGDRLQSITSSDGRSISLGWAGPRIVSASAHGRSWKYEYHNSGYLTRVELPDLSAWSYQNVIAPWPNYPVSDYSTTDARCLEPLQAHAVFSLTMTHPAGAVGRFNFQHTRHRRTGIPESACTHYLTMVGSGEKLYEMAIPDYFDVFSITGKSISGPGLSTQNWAYEYEIPVRGRAPMDPSAPLPCSNCQNAKSVLVTQPDGSKLEYRFGTLWSGNDGRLLETYTRGASNKIVAVERNQYVTSSEAANMPFPDWYGVSISGDDGSTHLIRPVKARVIAQDGAIAGPVYYVPPPTPAPPPPCTTCPPPPPRNCDPTTGICIDPTGVPGPPGGNQRQRGSFAELMTDPDAVTTSSDSTPASTFTRQSTAFDSFARPTQVIRHSSLGYSATDTHEYNDQLVRWVLGQVKKTTTAGLVTTETYHDPNTALPLWSKSFGKLQHTLAYYGDGTLRTVTDGRGNTTTLSSWKRGVPQQIAQADGAFQSAAVDDSGWVSSVTSEVGAKTCYGYDAMGRLAQITYPSEAQNGVCDSSTWNITTQSFVQVNGTEYGIPAGHWRQTVSTGNARRITYFDGLWRPLVTREFDSANEAGTRRFQRFTYDHEGRTRFASYPGTTDALNTGVWSEYDALGRPTSSSQDSELGLLTTRTEYLPGLKTRVTPPNANAASPAPWQTTTSYMAYDQPSLDMPVSITHPEGAYTDIVRNPFGKPTWLIRRNAGSSLKVERRYFYNTHQELCRVMEPETGGNLMGYDAAGNLAWSASGLHPSTACNSAGNTAEILARRVNRAYDARNRITHLNFPDAQGNQSWTYAADGQVVHFVVNNGGVSTGTNYNYNKRQHLTHETHWQGGGIAVDIGYGYTPNGHYAAIRNYNTGALVDYTPNALGQPTQAGPWATGVQYHPNGAVAQFTYGNGKVHTVEQNARQLPQRVQDSGNTMNLFHTYDANANVAAIYDGVDTTLHRYLQYDRLDRLTAAGSVAFGGDHWHRFTYDALDNIRSWKLAGKKDYANYVYNPTTNHLQDVRDSTNAMALTFEYDVQGNVTRKNGQSYVFDFGNRLRSATARAPGSGTETYRYDGHGRRIQSSSPTLGTSRSYYTQRGQLAYVHDDRKGNGVDHVYLGSRLVATLDRNWAAGTTVTKYQHTDALGSPVAVSNQAGVVIERTNWEPFGAAIGKTVDGVGYTGHVMDGATGLTYMQQRYYDPQVGRFLTVDPVTAYDQPVVAFNRYRYANNNPYKFTDPDGRFGRPDPPHMRITTESRTQNANGSVTVQRITSASDIAPPPPTGGTVVLLPQHRSADGAPATTGDKIMTRLLNFSEKANATVEVTSGQRTVEQNRGVGGASRSQHLQDNAADIRISGNTPKQTADAAHSSGEFNRVNQYTDGRGVHVDLKQDGTQGRFTDWKPQK